jgi:hypothetical protein
MIEYKTWEGKWPNVILLSGEDIGKILYYETGFEQLHPDPAIIDWMEERGYNYYYDWRVVRVDPRILGRHSEWAICFPNKQILELFLLKWP